MVNKGNFGQVSKYNQIRNIEWPNNADFAVCLTHDVDRVKKTYQYFTHSIKRRSLKPFLTFFDEKEPYWQFDTIMNLEKKHDVRSTFFFLNESQRFRLLSRSSWVESLGRYNIQSLAVKTIIRKLDAGGWEIALHGSINSFDNISLLGKEKFFLEAIVGHSIKGIRQHWLNLDIPKTWQMHKDLGLVYDTSFGKKYKVGFKNVICHPFRPFKDAFMVFPLAIMDSFLFENPFEPGRALEKMKKIIKIAMNAGGLLTVLWHQSVFSEKDFPGYSKFYEILIEECITRNAWFGTCSEVYDHIAGEISR